MRTRWVDIWSELRAAAAAPTQGILLMLLSIASFIMALWVVMAVVRVVAG